MANTNLRSAHSKAFHALGFFVFLLLVQRNVATGVPKVGDSKGWSVPTDPNVNSLNQWAEMHRFEIGDSILFVYQPDKDSVLQVHKEDYTNCSTTAPIESFNDGNTKFTFKQSGPFYFISGNADNCLKNEKLVVVVMGDRSNHSNKTSFTSPPSPSPFPGYSGITPSLAPVSEESPSPPTPSPPNNGASSIAVGFMSSIGAFVGSILMFVL